MKSIWENFLEQTQVCSNDAGFQTMNFQIREVSM